MNHRKLIDDAWTYNANIRAEDGPQPPTRWRALQDSVYWKLRGAGGEVAGRYSTGILCGDNLVQRWP